jgi:ketosteroid isomerase-like protein
MSDQNVDIARSAYAAFGRGDVEGVLNTLDPNIEWTTPGPEGLLHAGTRRGRDSVREFFRTITDLYEFQEFVPKQFIPHGELVIVLGEDTFKVKATGTVLHEHWAHAMTIRNGKVVAFREYLDTSALVADMRLAQTPA